MSLETVSGEILDDLRSDLPAGAAGFDFGSVAAIAAIIVELISQCSARGATKADLVAAVRKPTFIQRLTVRMAGRRELGRLRFQDRIGFADSFFRIGGNLSDAEIGEVIDEASQV